MLKGIKTGMGLAIGVTLGCALMGFMKEEIMRWGAKDEEFMDQLKTDDPKLYEELDKYR